MPTPARSAIRLVVTSASSTSSENPSAALQDRRRTWRASAPGAAIFSVAFRSLRLRRGRTGALRKPSIPEQTLGLCSRVRPRRELDARTAPRARPHEPAGRRPRAPQLRDHGLGSDALRHPARHQHARVRRAPRRRRPSARRSSRRREHPISLALYRERLRPRRSTPERLERAAGRHARPRVRALHPREPASTPLRTLLALGEPKNLLEYQFRRAYKLHDLMHVVLGADATVLGEVPIVAYSLGQAKDEGARAPALALAVLFMNIGLRRPREMREAVRRARALARGRRAHALARRLPRRGPPRAAGGGGARRDARRRGVRRISRT